MKLNCTQCLSPIGERTGYETPSGEALCGPCYFALWGPKGRQELSRAGEAARPRSHRGRPIWIPGPTGETDPRISSRRSWRQPRG